MPKGDWLRSSGEMDADGEVLHEQLHGYLVNGVVQNSADDFGIILQRGQSLKLLWMPDHAEVENLTALFDACGTVLVASATMTLPTESVEFLLRALERDARDADSSNQKGRAHVVRSIATTIMAQTGVTLDAG